MATKDWKKTKDEDTWIIYEKGSSSSYSGNKRLSIAKMYSEKIINNHIKQKYTWVVDFGEINMGSSKLFETRFQALSFARKYMRSH